jgi:predicted metal-dependent phosphotriesterase family hydrolase
MRHYEVEMKWLDEILKSGKVGHPVGVRPYLYETDKEKLEQAIRKYIEEAMDETWEKTGATGKATRYVDYDQLRKKLLE